MSTSYVEQCFKQFLIFLDTHRRRYVSFLFLWHKESYFFFEAIAIRRQIYKLKGRISNLYVYNMQLQVIDKKFIFYRRQ